MSVCGLPARGLIRVLVVAFLLPLVSARAAQDAVVPDLGARATRYVEEYEQQLSAVVCEERQTQRVVKSDGKTAKTRELVADLLIIRAAGPNGQFHTQTFRDVIAVDGKTIRDRQ